MSKTKQSQSNSKQSLTAIKARLTELGVNNPSLPSFLQKELEEQLAEARQRADAKVAEAQRKAAARLVKAETTALEKLLKPAHVCSALARLLRTATPSTPVPDEPESGRKQKTTTAREELGS
jgi:molecular chaperone GrpE (heat shock protein)